MDPGTYIVIKTPSNSDSGNSPDHMLENSDLGILIPKGFFTI